MSQVLRYVVETSACLILFYAVYWLFLKKETFFFLNRIYLLASLLLSFVIPALRVPSPFLTVPLPSAPVVAETAAALPARSWGVADAIVLIYAAGVLVFLARFIIQVVNLFLVVRRSGSRDFDGLRIVSVDREFAPFSFLKFIFVNEHDFSPSNLGHILAHERAHIRQGHSLDVLLAELATVAQWFNPIVRPYKRSIQETHEFLADSEVIAQGFNSARYQLVMLEQQVGSRLLGFSSNFKQSQIKRRIVMMSQIRSKGAARLKALLLMPLAALLVLALAQPRPIVAADPSPLPGLQDKTDQTLDEHKKQEMITRATENLALLKEKEAKLKKALETAGEPEKQKELQKSLQVILELEKNTEAFIKDPTLPPPPPLPPPAPGKSGLKMLKEKEAALRSQLATEKEPAKVLELQHDLQVVLTKEADPEAQVHFAKEIHPPAPPAPTEEAAFKMLQDKEIEIQKALASETDPAKQKELKAALQKVRMKELDLQASLAAVQPPVQPDQPVPPVPPSLHSPMADYKMLKEKELKIKDKLKTAADAEEQAKLKAMLDEVLKKQQAIQAAETAGLGQDIAPPPPPPPSPPPALTLAGYKQMLSNLLEKEKAVQAELANTSDPQKTAELKDLLKKIAQKRETIKAKIEELKNASEVK
jgi:hypothetical protein